MLLTQRQASGLLNVSIDTVKRLRKTGQLPTIKVGRSVRPQGAAYTLMEGTTMAKKKMPPRLGTDAQGNYYVFYHANGRSQRKSLRTDNLFHAEARFAGWLEAHNKDFVVEPTQRLTIAWTGGSSNGLKGGCCQRLDTRLSSATSSLTLAGCVLAR